jgi:hypothetical protein
MLQSKNASWIVPHYLMCYAMLCYNHTREKHVSVRNPTPEGRGLVRSRQAVSEAHLTRLSLETSYVRSEIGTLGCEASPNLYGYRLNRCTRVKPVLATRNRSLTWSRPPLPEQSERLKGQNT